MTDFAQITDVELAQARADPVFRQKLLAEHLERLIAALNFLRSTDAGDDPVRAQHISEGVRLAMRLSNILHRLGRRTGVPVAGWPN